MKHKLYWIGGGFILLSTIGFLCSYFVRKEINRIIDELDKK